MVEDYYAVLKEIKEMLRVIMEGQRELMLSVKELKEEQKRLHDEIRMSKLGLNNIPVRSEILN